MLQQILNALALSLSLFLVFRYCFPVAERCILCGLTLAWLSVHNRITNRSYCTLLQHCAPRAQTTMMRPSQKATKIAFNRVCMKESLLLRAEHFDINHQVSCTEAVTLTLLHKGLWNWRNATPWLVRCEPGQQLRCSPTPAEFIYKLRLVISLIRTAGAVIWQRHTRRVAGIG